MNWNWSALAAVAACMSIALNVILAVKKFRKVFMNHQLLKDLQSHLHCIQGSQELSRGRGFDVYSFRMRVGDVDALAQRVEQAVQNIES